MSNGAFDITIGPVVDAWGFGPGKLHRVVDRAEAIALSDKVVLFTGRPGTVKRIFDVPLARPRNVFEIHNEKGFTDLYHEIWSHFKTEIRV